MTKANAAIVRSYNNSTARNLYDVYGTFSAAKIPAFDYCRSLCYKSGGRDLRILSANTFQFTAAFRFEMSGEPYLMYITKSCDRAIKLDA